MNEAARLFLGEHDWTAFSAANADAETSRPHNYGFYRRIKMGQSRSNSAIIEFNISGNGFLRYMVRSIVGTMLEVGRDEKDSDTIQTAIINGDRSLAGPTSPAHGLTLLKVHYE